MKKYLISFQQKEKSEKVFLFALGTLVFLGLLFRSRHYFAGRSLWLDEAMLALNVLELSFGELTHQPLPYQQGAPIGFLFFMKATTLLLGDSEFSFRLFSYLASISALGIFAFLAKEYLNKVGALFAVALFSSSPFIIYYSAETKQYMGDLFTTLFLFFLLHWLLKKEYSSRAIFFLTIGSSISLWFSHAAIFSVVATGVILLVHYFRAQNKRAFGGIFLSLSFTGANALILYWFHIRPLSASKFLVSFWDDAFMPLPPSFSWVGAIWASILENPLGLTIFPALAFLLLFAGIIFLWRRHWQLAAVLLFTLVFTLMAGALQKYPLAERMLLFWAPTLIIFFGAGLSYIYDLIRKKYIALILSVLLAFIFLFSPMQEAFAKLEKPLYREHIRPTMGYLKDNLRDDDLVYLYHYTEPAFRFYLPKYSLEQIQYVVGGSYETQPEKYLTEINNLKLKGRVWFLFSHVYEDASINEEEFIRSYLDEIGEKKRKYRYPGSSVSLYLYEFSTGK